MVDLHPHRTADDNVDMKEKPKRRRGLKWFVIDLWWLHLIVALILGLIITLIVTYVVYPKIAKQQVAAAKLELTDLTISDPQPNSIGINITAKLSTHSPFHATLKPWNGTLYLPDGKPFLTLPVPTTKAVNNQLINIDTTAPIPADYMDGFTEFSKALVTNNTITSYLKGSGKLQLGKLPNVEVTYNKPLTLNAFQGLKGVTVSDPVLLLTNQPDGATLTAKTVIPNPTIQTVQLGNITLDISVPASVLGMAADTPIGYAMINNTILKPGNNTFTSRSVTNQTLLIDMLLQHPNLYSNGLPIQLQGKEVMMNGQVISYLSAGLAASPITQTLDVGTAIDNAGLGSIFTNPSSAPTVRSVEEEFATVEGPSRGPRKVDRAEGDLNGWAPALLASHRGKLRTRVGGDL